MSRKANNLFLLPGIYRFSQCLFRYGQNQVQISEGGTVLLKKRNTNVKLLKQVFCFEYWHWSQNIACMSFLNSTYLISLFWGETRS